jgi:hypothetical protein
MLVYIKYNVIKIFKFDTFYGLQADLMIMCAYPVRAMQELVGMDIFWIVFRLPYDLKHHILEETQRCRLHS